jgi:nitrite reductase (NO-forming)
MLSNYRKTIPSIAFLIIFCLTASACAGPAQAQPGAANGSGSSSNQEITFKLKTNMADGKLNFIGQGGDIDGISNPDLKVTQGQTVHFILTNNDGMEHDFAIPDLNIQTDHVSVIGKSASTTVKADKAGDFLYYCTLPGHKQLGMVGHLIVTASSAAAAPAADMTMTMGAPTAAPGGSSQPVSAPSIARDPADLPGPIGNRPAQHVRIDLETVELTGQLADGVGYTYWTFNGKVPGPFLRVRVGDTVELHLKNNTGSRMTHSIDLHAVTGPGGGAAVMQVSLGEEKWFTFKPLNPGLFVYHCATPMVADHIASGMFGLILVEPEGGLPKVDLEYYVMQSELYTSGPYGQKGQQEIDIDKLMAEAPEYFVFNGATTALTQQFPLHAKVGETVRIFFGDAGPNLPSSLHMIGEVFDKVYDQASLTSEPLTNVQTTLVPPGGATVVELTTQVPGRFLLVDHAIVRMERGLMGYLLVDGPDNPEVFHSDFPASGSGH